MVEEKAGGALRSIRWSMRPQWPKGLPTASFSSLSTAAAVAEDRDGAGAARVAAAAVVAVAITDVDRPNVASNGFSGIVALDD